MKVRGKGGLLDFSKDERNKENSFLDVDWMITELINYGHEKMVPTDSDSSPNDTSNAGITPRRSASFKSPITKPKPKKVSTKQHSWKIMPVDHYGSGAPSAIFLVGNFIH